MSLTWEVFTGGFCQTNGYLLSLGGRHFLIDAPDDSADWLRSLGVRIDALLLTHQHFDHVMDAARIAREHGCGIHAWTQPTPDLWLNKLFSGMTGWALDIEPYTVTHELRGTERLELGTLDFTLLHVPGHSPDSVCFYHAPTGVCFAGDTLFEGGVGRTDFPGGGAELLYGGIREKLYTLPHSTRILPGHGGETTVGVEKESNPFVRP